MNLENHFKKDIAYHAETAHEYDAVVVRPREEMNEILFRDIQQMVPAGDCMLDIGTGTGHAIVRFGNKFRSVVGVDHSDKMLAEAQKNLAYAGITNAKLINMDLFDFLEQQGQQFDFISAIGCLHHIPPDMFLSLLRALQKNLTDSGVLLIADPIKVDLEKQPEAIQQWNSISVASTLGFTSVAEEADEDPIDYVDLRATLKNAGLEISYENRAWELFPHHMPATRTDKRQVEKLHAKYGSTGNVVAVLCKKSSRAAVESSPTIKNRILKFFTHG